MVYSVPCARNKRPPAGPSSLTLAQREAFAELLMGAKEAAGVTFDQIADHASEILGGGDDAIGWSYVAWLFSGPPRPLASPRWAGAIFLALGIGWAEVLATLGALQREAHGLIVCRGVHRLVIRSGDLEANGDVWLLEMIARWQDGLGGEE
jgi:hypothetical protein